MPSRHHLPPAVRYPVQRLRVPWMVGAAVWAGSGVLLLLWWSQTGPQVPLIGLCGAGLWLLVGVMWLRQWRQAPQGWLQWDGGAWWWQAHGDTQAQALLSLHLQVDLQHVTLVAWRTGEGSAAGQYQYAWLARSSAPWRWGDWRRAVYSAATVSRTAGPPA